MKGYYLVTGKHAYLYITEAQRKTAAVVNYFIDTIAAEKNLCPELIARIKADKQTVDRIRQDIEPVTVNENRFWESITITGRSFTLNYPTAALHKAIDCI